MGCGLYDSSLPSAVSDFIFGGVWAEDTAKSFILYLSLMFIYGIALTAVHTTTTTLIQEKSDLKMMGRVFGLFGSVHSGFLPVRMAVFRPLADEVNLRIIMIVCGAALYCSIHFRLFL